MIASQQKQCVAVYGLTICKWRTDENQFSPKNNKANPGLLMLHVSLLRIEDAGDYKIVITSRSVLFNMEYQQT